MSYQYPEIRTFRGRYRQANSFNVPDGAFETLNNFVITEDEVVTKRRGFYEYFASGRDVSNLFFYDNRLIAFYADNSAYFTETGTSPNEVGSETLHTGVTVEITEPRQARSDQANNNLYTTTDNGVVKLESYDSKRYSAGVPPALDMRGDLLASNGVVSGNSQTSWRVVFGRRDSNDNLLLSAPSDKLTLTNQSFASSSYVSAGAGPYTVTVTTMVDHDLSTGMIVEVSNATDADANGSFTITVTGSNTFTYTTTNDPTSGTLDVKASRSALLEFSIPDEINDVSDGYFFQIYRTDPSIADTALPFNNYKLANERQLTAAEITAGFVIYEDVSPDLILGAELYTNPNSREGELQANDRPPLCEDITVFKGHVFYANVKTRPFLDLDVIDPSLITSGNQISIQVGAVERIYEFNNGVANRTVEAESVAGVGTVTITYTGHGFSNGDTVYISTVTGSVSEGEYVISGVTANTFDISDPGNTATALWFQGVTTAAGNGYVYFNAVDSASIQLRDTAAALVKAINRDDSSVIYAKYVSDPAQIPGQMRFLAKFFNDPIEVKVSSTVIQETFDPTLPTTYDGSVISDDDDQPNVFYSSKIDEPEAVPIVNFFRVGRKKKSQNEIQRIISLKDSTIILSQSGIYRLTGDQVSNFSITALDDTVFCLNKRLVAKLNNEIIFLSNQGLCLVTENSVRIVSYKIENDIQPTLGKSGIETEGFAIGYESERLWLGCMIEPQTETASVVHCYNPINDTWTTWDQLYTCGVVGPSDTLYIASSDNRILKERKKQTRLDYCGQQYSTTVISVNALEQTAIIDSVSAAPEAGDVLVLNDVINRIDSALLISGTQYSVSFLNPISLEFLDTPTLYKGIASDWELAPFHGGLLGRAKQFAQMQIHLRGNGLSRCFIGYRNTFYEGTGEVDWKSVVAGSDFYDGWGADRWGLFPWGNERGIELEYGTQPAPIMRDYVSRLGQRATYLKPLFRHVEAAERVQMQAISFAVRSYKERLVR